MPFALTPRIKAAIQAIEPDATVILYGSRARGSAQVDSDWDLLVLVDGVVDLSRKQAIRRALYDLEWETGEVITSHQEPRGVECAAAARVASLPGGSPGWGDAVSAPISELAAYRLARARETLTEAKSLSDGGRWHGVANRLYNACF